MRHLFQSKYYWQQTAYILLVTKAGKLNVRKGMNFEVKIVFKLKTGCEHKRHNKDIKIDSNRNKLFNPQRDISFFGTLMCTRKLN